VRIAFDRRSAANNPTQQEWPERGDARQDQKSKPQAAFVRGGIQTFDRTEHEPQPKKNTDGEIRLQESDERLRQNIHLVWQRCQLSHYARMGENNSEGVWVLTGGATG